MKNIPSGVWIVLTLVVGVGFLAFLSSNRERQAVQGRELPVQVEVYVDYNCPHCADFEPFVQEVEASYGEKVVVAHKHLPFLNASSTTYAEATEAARKQEKFIEYHRNLFKWITYQSNPANTTFTYSDEEKTFFSQPVEVSKLAEYLGLDTTKFQEDLQSEDVKNTVKSQKEQIVRKLGGQSTPTVLIYDEQLQMKSYEDFKNRIDAVISDVESRQTT
jgi:predicted DsbA family dithiol-disulfide isomerase